VLYDIQAQLILCCHAQHQKCCNITGNIAADSGCNTAVMQMALPTYDHMLLRHESTPF
jgi:hypothetical protein